MYFGSNRLEHTVKARGTKFCAVDRDCFILKSEKSKTLFNLV